MVNSSRRAGLGNLLNKVQKQASQRRNPRKSDRHTVEANPNQDYARLNLRSVTAQTNLDEFFEEAELAGKQFVTERRNIARVNEDEPQTELYSENEKLEREPMEKLEEIDIANSLSVPRRPKWDADTTPEVLAEREKLTFLSWRKKLAKLQENENLILTPFEKNIEVWRQLWRVVERSDIVVQILDCRNPLLYLCDDLIKYVDEEFNGTKMNLILLNKADYLTREQRKIWSHYFKERGIRAIFFSALYENENLKKANHTSEAENQGPHSESSRASDSDTENEDDGVRKEECDVGNQVAEDLKNSLTLDTDQMIEDETRIFDRFELLDEWHSLLKQLESSRIKNLPSQENDNVENQNEDSQRVVKFPEDISEHSSSHNRPLTVGLVGYPNVGKSSTINALLSAKRVAVSATPGKTKHFQTFLIDRDMMLCDCPGLVFPNFVSCKSEMIINGILPIDQMRDYVGPVRIIVSRIPRGYFEDIYGLAFEYDAKQNIVAEDLLNAFGFMRGYMTARGLPDISRAARKVCKDYINGKILYCEPPPNADKKVFFSHSKLAEAMKRIEERGNDPNTALKITERQRRLMVQAKGTAISSREFDAKHFQPKTGAAHIKGLPGIGNMTQPIGQFCESNVPKRERKHKKREKLRRVYRDLDI